MLDGAAFAVHVGDMNFGGCFGMDAGLNKDVAVLAEEVVFGGGLGWGGHKQGDEEGEMKDLSGMVFLCDNRFQAACGLCTGSLKIILCCRFVRLIALPAL